MLRSAACLLTEHAGQLDASRGGKQALAILSARVTGRVIDDARHWLRRNGHGYAGRVQVVKRVLASRIGSIAR